MLGVVDWVPKQCFQPLLPLKVANGTLVLLIGTIPARVGPIVIIRLSQPASRAGAWAWLSLAIWLKEVVREFQRGGWMNFLKNSDLSDFEPKPKHGHIISSSSFSFKSLNSLSDYDWSWEGSPQGYRMGLCQNPNLNTTVGVYTKMTLQPPPPPTQTQCQRYLGCYWPNVNQTLNVGSWDEQQQEQQQLQQ